MSRYADPRIVRFHRWAKRNRKFFDDAAQTPRYRELIAALWAEIERGLHEPAPTQQARSWQAKLIWDGTHAFWTEGRLIEGRAAHRVLYERQTGRTLEKNEHLQQLCDRAGCVAQAHQQPRRGRGHRSDLLRVPIARTPQAVAARIKAGPVPVTYAFEEDAHLDFTRCPVCGQAQRTSRGECAICPQRRGAERLAFQQDLEGFKILDEALP